MSFCFIKGLISVRHHFGSIYFIWTALLITLLQSYHIPSTQYISWQTKKKHSTKSFLSQTHRLLYHRHSSYCFIPTYSLLFVYMHIPNCFMKTHSIQFKKTHSIYCFKHTLHTVSMLCYTDTFPTISYKHIHCYIQPHVILFHGVLYNDTQ